MRKLTLLAIVSFAALGVAQSPLVTLSGGTNQGNVGGGIYFDLQINTTVTITQIDFRCGANTAVGTGTLDVFLGPNTYSGNVANPALWTLVSSATVGVAPSAVSLGVLSTPIGLAPGNYGVALRSNLHNHGYTNGVTCSSNTIPGSCSNSVFSNAEMTLRAGAAQNVFLSGGIFNPRIFNGALHYTLGGTPIHVAAWQGYGDGCYAWFRSFYQLFPNPVGLNLGTGQPVQALLLAFNNGTYTVSASNTPMVVPTSTPVALTGPDSTFMATAALGGPLPFAIFHPLNGAVSAASDLEIATEGYIVPSPATQPIDATPTVGEFLSQATRWAPHWKSMDPVAAGGGIYVEVVSGVLLVTWQNVVDTGLTTNSTFQVAYYPNGDVEYRYGAMSGNGGGNFPIIVGWTEGNGALDPGIMEIITAVPFSTESQDNLPLSLWSDNRPRLGTSINLVTDAIPTGTSLGAMLLGFAQFIPPVPLTSAGMDGCFLHLSADAAASYGVVSPSNLFPLVIPNIPALNGGRLNGQAVTISAGFNPAGILTSNAIEMVLGSL